MRIEWTQEAHAEGADPKHRQDDVRQ